MIGALVDVAVCCGQVANDGSVAVIKGLRDFQEHLGGELTVTLLDAIGTGIEVHQIDETMMLEAIAWLKSREAG